MKKQIFRSLMCIALLLMILTGCQNDLPAGVNGTTVPSQTSLNEPDNLSTPSNRTPQPYPKETMVNDDPSQKTKSLFEVGNVVYANNLGFDGFGPSFYWSPNNQEVLFEGFKKYGEGKYTPSVYYFNIKSQKIIEIIQGNLDENYYLDEPVWSSDSDEVLLSFNEFTQKDPVIQLYNIQNEKLEILPIKGRQAEFSPDETKILYVGPDESLHIYQRSNGTIQTLPAEMKGHSPLWFSDNRHILFFKDTGKNPFGLDGGRLYTLCILDTQEPDRLRVLGGERVYQNLHWVLQDNVAWIDSGWDDGHFVGLLDISANIIQELGETGFNQYLLGQKPRIIWKQNDNDWKVMDIQQNNFTEYQACPAQSMPLSLLADEKILFFQNSIEEPKSSLLAISSNGHTSILTEDNNYLYPRISSDGSKLAFIDSNGDFLITADAMMLMQAINDVPGIPLNP